VHAQVDETGSGRRGGFVGLDDGWIEDFSAHGMTFRTGEGAILTPLRCFRPRRYCRDSLQMTTGILSKLNKCIDFAQTY
jgi:hypothetical protein